MDEETPSPDTRAAEWTWTLQAVDPVPSPRESFLSLQAIALAEPADLVPGGPIAPCARTWFELTLLDDMGAPIVGARCKLLFPEGAGQSGVTDEEGRAHFPDIVVDASVLHTIVYVTEDAQAGRIVDVEVVPQAGPSTVDEGGDEDDIEYISL